MRWANEFKSFFIIYYVIELKPCVNQTRNVESCECGNEWSEACALEWFLKSAFMFLGSFGGQGFVLELDSNQFTAEKRFYYEKFHKSE